jgi:lipopolysaccharide/colanic/teichoic acid biosynthesis glycosyltransferase
MLSPVLLLLCLAIWLQDFSSPIYFSKRVGQDGKEFKMLKLRSMVANAENSGVLSTSSRDKRITPLGHFVRRYKFDEILQLINVIQGDMSLVGPRPNVISEVALYTPTEKGLLSVRPGITDLASIVFSDEGDILRESSDPDWDYMRLIRPGKSELGIFYVENRSLFFDFQIVILTLLNLFSRKSALLRISRILISLNAPHSLNALALRDSPLEPRDPPGFLKS